MVVIEGARSADHLRRHDLDEAGIVGKPSVDRERIGRVRESCAGDWPRRVAGEIAVNQILGAQRVADRRAVVVHHDRRRREPAAIGTKHRQRILAIGNNAPEAVPAVPFDAPRRGLILQRELAHGFA